MLLHAEEERTKLAARETALEREVKGWSKNRRDGLTRLKMAAAHYPWWTFVLVERIGGQWKETIIPA